jgi:uncharacterized protein YciI
MSSRTRRARSAFLTGIAGLAEDAQGTGHRAADIIDGMKYFVLFYYLVEDYVARRVPLREEHLALARAANRRGELLLAGALSDPADRAVFVFRVANPSVVEDFVKLDPYVLNGLVTRWEVRPWNVVVGNEPFDASAPTPTPEGTK